MAGNGYTYYSSGTADISSWTYTGSASYETGHGDCIGVDKGSPDKAKFVIFYAKIEDKDPMIFCKTQEELDSEMKKLLKREDVDKKSIRVFALTSVALKKFNLS